MEESTPPLMGEGVENSQLVVVRDKARPDLMNPVHRASYHDHMMCDASLFLPLLPSSGVFPTVSVHSSGPPSGIPSGPSRSSAIGVLCSGVVAPQQCLDIWGSDGQGRTFATLSFHDG